MSKKGYYKEHPLTLFTTRPGRIFTVRIPLPMSDRVSNRRKPRAQHSPYIPPASRVGRRNERKAATSPPGSNIPHGINDEVSAHHDTGRPAEILLVEIPSTGDARGMNMSNDRTHVSPSEDKKMSRKPTVNTCKPMPAIGGARDAVSKEAATSTKATLAKASAGHHSTLDRPTSPAHEKVVMGKNRSREGGAECRESRPTSCRPRSGAAFADGNPSPHGTERRRDAPGGQRSRRKPRQAWSPYEPPGRRAASSSLTFAHDVQKNAWLPNAETAAASLSTVKGPAETSAVDKLAAKRAVTDEHTTYASPAPLENLRGPASPNVTQESSYGGDGTGSAREKTADRGSAVVIGWDGYEVEIETEMSTGTGAGPRAAEIRASVHLETRAEPATYAPETEEDETLATRHEARGARQTLDAFPTGRSISSESTSQKLQGDGTPEDWENSAVIPGETMREGCVGLSGNGSIVLPERGTTSTLARSCEPVSNRTRAPMTREKEEERPTSPDVNEAPPEQQLHVMEEEDTPRSDVDVRARGNGSPVTGSDSKPEKSVPSSGCGAGNLGGEVDETGSNGKPTPRVPVERYVPPGRRKILDAATTRADNAEEWMGPLWPSRAPIRVRQKERPSDGQTSESSPTRPAPARVAGVVSGGMSAYGANISEYSEHMSRRDVEACTALITKFPSALPPCQRESMLEPFISLGALITWPRPDEALATFATSALARQAVSTKANRSTVLVVDLLSNASTEKRKAYQRIELSRPGRPPTDVSSASRLISGALGLRRTREKRSGNNAVASISSRSAKSGVRGRGAKTESITECTDSWDM